MRSYLDEFLSLRCAPDVLEAVYPLRRPEKEISESMALVTAARSKLLKHEARELPIGASFTVGTLPTN